MMASFVTWLAQLSETGTAAGSGTIRGGEYNVDKEDGDE